VITPPSGSNSAFDGAAGQARDDEALRREEGVPVYALGPGSAISGKVLKEVEGVAGAKVERISGDNPVATLHPRILKAHEEFVPWADFRGDLELLKQAVKANDTASLRALLLKHVSGFTPDTQESDLVGLASL
jgi:hypothetical protein